MKVNYIFVLFALLLMACSKPEGLEKMEDQLSSKKSKLESVKKQVSTLSKEIETLEKEIAKAKGVEIQKGKLVTAMEVKAGEFSHFIEVQGTAQSEKNISISTDVGGLVTI